MGRNKWNIRKAKRSARRGGKLVSAATRLKSAERALSLAETEAISNGICQNQLAPAYAALCRLPAVTWRDLSIKMLAVLDELENGPTAHTPTLIRTTRSALEKLSKRSRPPR